MPPTFSADWFSHNIPVWDQLLAASKGRPDLRFLEIGCFEGRATCWLLQHVLTHPQSRIVCVDSFAGGVEVEYAAMDLRGLFERFLANVQPYVDRVDVRRATSFQALCELNQQPGRFDFVYIDASHQAADVLADATLAFPLLQPGGLLVFDDYGKQGGQTRYDMPRIGIDAFLDVYGPKLEIVHRGYQLAVRRRR